MKITAPAHLREPRDLAFLGRAARARTRLEIDLGAVEWISPAGVAALLAACLGADTHAIKATVQLPESRMVRTYLGQIGFLAELERHGWVGDDEIDVNPDAAIGPHLPVTRLTTENEVTEASGRLYAVLQDAGLASYSLIDVAVELAGNACEHGSECYAVAQVYSGVRSGTPGVHLAVADFGGGFAETFREHYDRMTDSEAIVHALDEQVSGTGHPYRGFGLSQIVEVIDAAPGNVLHIVSRSGYVVRSGGRVEAHDSTTPLFCGTLASVYIPYGPPSPL